MNLLDQTMMLQCELLTLSSCSRFLQPAVEDAVIKSLHATGCGAIEGRLKYNLV